MTAPFFSICIAAYNANRYIGDCLFSIASQTCQDYEVVVVDDGSPEPLFIPSDITDVLSSCRIIRTENCGPYAARQCAYREAVGEVILTVDADDELSNPRALENIFLEFKCDADVVFFNATSLKSSSSVVLDFSGFVSYGDFLSASIWDVFTTSSTLNSLWCKAFRRNLIVASEKKSRPRLLMAEDRLQSLEVMAEARSFKLIKEPLYYYRPNPASTINAGYDPSYYFQQCYVEAEVLNFMHKHNMSLSGWAAYFLSLTSNVLLGIRYNSSLMRDERVAAYKAMIEEPVLRRAFSYFDGAKLRRVDTLRLNLLCAEQFTLLDVSMLPWRVGSTLKHLLVN